jgi:O-antigen/teichoic acid export membrane protein
MVGGWWRRTCRAGQVEGKIMSVLRKGMIASGASVCCAGLGMLTNVFLSRALAPEGMGRYQLPLTAGVLAITLLSLGVGQANIYFLNRHKIAIPQITMNSIWYGMAGGCLLMAFIPTLLSLFEGYFGQLPLWAKVIFGVDAAALFVFHLLRPILVAGLQIKQDVLAQVTQKGLVLLIVAVGFFWGFLTVPIALSMTAAGDLLALGIVGYYLRDHIVWAVRFSGKVFRQTLVYGIKIFTANFVYVMNVSLGLLLLRYLMPDNFAAVGHYGRAVSLGGFVMLIPTAVGPLLYAKWSGLSGAQRKAEVALAMRLHLVMAGSVIAGLTLFGHWLILLLYGEDFLEAVAPLRTLAWGIGCRCLFSVCHNLLTSDGKAHITTYVYLVGVAITAVLTWVLVPRFGIEAPAIADAAAGGYVFGVALVILTRKYGCSIAELVVPRKADFGYLKAAFFRRSVTAY